MSIIDFVRSSNCYFFIETKMNSFLKNGNINKKIEFFSTQSCSGVIPSESAKTKTPKRLFHNKPFVAFVSCG